MRLSPLLLGIPLVVLFACDSGGQKKAGPPPTPQVDVEAVRRADVSLYVEAVAAIDGYINADIRARVRGYLRSQNYRDGAAVKEGDLLFTIEATEYQAAVASAKAALARAKAAKQLADIDIQRVRKLREMNAVPQQQLDQAEASASDTEAQVHAAEAQLEQANLSLSYTQIRSPVTGVAGLAQVRVGNLVGQNEPTLLTTVSQVDPMRVRFPISELDYLKQPQAMKELAGRDLKWAQQQFAKADFDNDPAGLQLVLSDGSLYPHRGVLIAADRNIDTSTGTIQMEALFPNPDRFLKPGQFARVRIRRTDAGENVLVVSQKALTEVQGSFTAAVVGPDSKVSVRKVDVGPVSGDKRIITKGLSEGEKVIVSGIQRVRDGVTVQAKDVTSDETASASSVQSAGSATAQAGGPSAQGGETHGDAAKTNTTGQGATQGAPSPGTQR